METTSLIDIVGHPAFYIQLALICIPPFIWLSSFLGIHYDGVEGGLDAVDAADSSHVLDFLSMGSVPTSIIVSAFSFLLGWGSLGTVSIAFPLFSINEWLLSLGSLFVAFGPAVWLTRKLSIPLSKIFQNYGTTHEAGALVGRIGTVRTGQLDRSFGEIIVQMDNGERITLSARAVDANVMVYNEKVFILEYISERNYYLVEPYV